jgi:DNA-binding transcriptional ArsR family regulator
VLTPLEFSSKLKALSDEVRFKVLLAVATSPEPITVGTIANLIGVLEGLASHHAKILFNAGFLLRAAHGRYVFYQINQVALQDLYSNFQDLLLEINKVKTPTLEGYGDQNESI